MTTTTDTMMSTGELADREGAIAAKPRQGVDRALLSSTGYLLRQLAVCLAIIALVWLVVMLFRHLQTAALVAAGVALALGGGALFVRNQSLRRAH